MLGLHSKQVPRKRRVAWAAALAVVAPALFALRSTRFEGTPHWSGYVAVVVIGAVIGYYGCTWERDS